MRSGAYLLVGILALSVLAPLAIAHHERESREDARPHERPERRDDLRERPDGKRGEERRFGKALDTNISFSADGVDRDNRTYDLSGIGRADCRMRQNNNTSAVQVHCKGWLNATLADANGTTVKQGRIPVLIHARQNETGAWKWHVVSLGLHHRGPGMLVLRGETASLSGDDLSLSGGKGGAQLRVDDERLRLRLSEAAGTLESL